MKTATLRILCEGQTERGFVAQVLAPHLRVFRVHAKAEGLGRGAGGSVSFDVLREAIKLDVGRSRAHEFVTTMIDLYAIGEYPGAATRPGEPVAARVQRIEAAMAASLPNPRFIPHVQVHEFEALVFVDLDQLPHAFPDGEAKSAAESLRREIGKLAPEAIDDGEHTAPSKRLIRAIPEYAALKASVGPTITQRIGMSRLREACPHFSAWVTRLEQLAEGL